LYKKLPSLFTYAKTDHIKASFKFNITSADENGAVYFGFTRSAETLAKNKASALILKVGGVIKPYIRVEYNGTPYLAGNYTLTAFTTVLSTGTNYGFDLELNNSVLSGTLKDANGTELETKTLTFNGAKVFDGIDSFGISDHSAGGVVGAMVGTFDDLTVSSWDRWIHGYPQIGTAGAPNIVAENYFISDILAETWSQPTLLTSDAMFIPGYIKTNDFYIMLGNGNDEAGNLTYDVSGNATSLATAKTFTVEGLTGTATVNLKVYNLSANTAYLVKDNNITDGGNTITIATTDSSGVLTFSGTLGSTHTYEVFQDTTAPTGVGVSTFGTITASSIEIIKPATVTENESGLYQWQVRRNSVTGLGLNSINTTSVIDSSLSQNTQYSYDSQFNDNAGNVSTYGTLATKYTLANTPTNLSASSDLNSVSLTVDSFLNATSDLSGYYFSRSGATSGWIQTNSWTDTGLSCSHSYDYSVKYRNGEGVETSSISITKSTNRCGSGGMLAGWNNLPVISTGKVFPKYNLGTSTLRNGSKGEAVMELQRFLNNKLNFSLAVDGKLGSKTIIAIKKLQKENGLKVDGVVGEKTKFLINLFNK
jgi:hypothetical protein